MQGNLLDHFRYIDVQRLVKSLAVPVVVIIVVLAWFLWTKVYQNPGHIFWDMIDSSLSTNSVTEQLSNDNSGFLVNQTIQLQFGGQNLAHSLATVTRAGSVVKTEEISTTNADYIRYLSIVTNKKLANRKPFNFSSLLGKWGKANVSNSSSSSLQQLFDQSILGIVPVANLNPEQRHTLISYMKSANIYSINFNNVKNQTLNGRSVYTYSVSVNLSNYVKMIKKIGPFINAPQLQRLNPANYSSTSSIPYVISIDSLSHQLVRITTSAGSQTVTYNGHGVISSVVPPVKTISLTSLESQTQLIY